MRKLWISVVSVGVCLGGCVADDSDGGIFGSGDSMGGAYTVGATLSGADGSSDGGDDGDTDTDTSDGGDTDTDPGTSDDGGDGNSDTDPGTSDDGGDGDTGTDPGTSDDGGDGDECVPIGCDTAAASNPDTCANAYVIGRTDALGGFSYGGNTDGADNDSGDVCGPTSGNPQNWDSGNDEFFRLYLYAGETVAFGQVAGFDVRTKIYASDSCSGDANQCASANLVFTATSDGWHTLVVDGASSAFEDWGSYTITVTLNPSASACPCP